MRLLAARRAQMGFLSGDSLQACRQI